MYIYIYVCMKIYICVHVFIRHSFTEAKRPLQKSLHTLRAWCCSACWRQADS